jgi:hypothetical protein
VLEFGRMRHAVRLPAYEHAPALAERLVDMVDLERDPLVGVPGDHRALAGPDHDRARHHGEVDREHDRARDRAERDPPDAARRDQLAALGGHELVDHGRAVHPAIGRRCLGPGAQQGARRGLQGGGEQAQPGTARPGRVPLHVLQVPQAHPGPGGDLRLAQVQFRAPPRDPLA